MPLPTLESLKPYLIPSIMGALVGACMTLGFAPYSFAIAGIFSMALLAFFLVTKRLTILQGFALGYALGLIHFLTVFYWLIYVTAAGWITVSIYMAIYPAAWGAFMAFYLQRGRMEVPSSLYNIRFAFVGAAAWVVNEWLRGIVISGFPWNYLGVTLHSQTLLPLIQIASIGGILLVSFVAAFFGLMLGLTVWRIWREVNTAKYRGSHYDFFAAMALVCLCFIFGFRVMTQVPPVERDWNFLAIQPDIPEKAWQPQLLPEALEKEDRLTRLGMLDARTQGKKLDVVIWPEPAVAANFYESSLFSSVMKQLVIDSGAPIIFGSNDYMGGKVFNSSIILHLGGASDVYHKRHLVPFGEYVPIAHWLPFLRWFVPPGVDFSAGNTPKVFHLQTKDDEREICVAPLICFEDTVPEVVDSTIKLNPDIFINQTNDAWFQKSPAARQHLDIAIFRTIEHRKPLIRATNDGISAYVNERGVIVETVRDAQTGSPYSEGYILGTVQLRNYPETPYERYGKWIVWFSLLVCVTSSIPRILAYGKKFI